jgi:hypothetical protein
MLLEFEADSPITSLSVNDDFQMAAGTLSGKVVLYDIRNKKEPILSFYTTGGGEGGLGAGAPVTSLLFEPPQVSFDVDVKKTWKVT